MTVTANNFRQRVCDQFDRGVNAIIFAKRLGGVKVSEEPALAWAGEGQGYPWRFRDGSIALIREDGHEVAPSDAGVRLRIRQQYGF